MEGERTHATTCSARLLPSAGAPHHATKRSNGRDRAACLSLGTRGLTQERSPSHPDHASEVPQQASKHCQPEEAPQQSCQPEEAPQQSCQPEEAPQQCWHVLLVHGCALYWPRSQRSTLPWDLRRQRSMSLWDLQHGHASKQQPWQVAPGQVSKHCLWQSVALTPWGRLLVPSPSHTR